MRVIVVLKDEAGHYLLGDQPQFTESQLETTD